MARPRKTKKEKEAEKVAAEEEAEIEIEDETEAEEAEIEIEDKIEAEEVETETKEIEVADSGKKAVQILLGGLTHEGKIYQADEIETNPSQQLIELAKSHAEYYIRDLRKKVRVCRFVPYFKDKVSDAKGIDFEEIEKMKDHELARILINDYGFSRKKLATFSRSRLESYLYRLRQG